MRAASHRLRKLVMVASTAAAGGMAPTMRSIKRSASETPGIPAGASDDASLSTRKTWLRTLCRVLGAGSGRQDSQRAGRVPFKRARAVAGRTRQHCKISEPPGRQPDGGEEREDEYGPEGGPAREGAGKRGRAA